MAFEDRFGDTLGAVDLIQRALMMIVLGTVGIVILAVTLGRPRVALWTVAVGCWLLGGLQLLFPETLIRASRMGDRFEKSPSDPIEDAELRGKRLGALVFGLLGAALLVFQDAILGLF